MPRGRHLRQLKARLPDEATAVRYLHLWDDQALYANPAAFPPLTSSALFGNERPLALEVGCGSGHFLWTQAAAQPNCNFVGVEIASKRLYVALSLSCTGPTAVAPTQRGNTPLDNIKFIRADFKLLYPLLRSNSLQAIYLHFPDPHRTKYQHRRILDPLFLDHMFVALRPGGQLSVLTDEADFFMTMLALVEQDGRWAKTHPQPYLSGFNGIAQSHYQRLWESRGLPTWHFVVAKPPT